MRLVISRAIRYPLLSASLLTVVTLVSGGRAFARPQSRATDRVVLAASVPIQSMELKETTVLPSAAPNAFRGGTECDSKGDIFLQFGIYDFTRAQLEQDAAISEIIPDSKRIVAYGRSPLPASDYPNAQVHSFNAAPGGQLYALLVTRSDVPAGAPRAAAEYYVERFKDDGTADSVLHVDPPPGATHWFADSVGSFSNGSFLITGTSTASADKPSAGSWGPFTAIYDRNGRFVREVTLPDDIVNKMAKGDKSHSASHSTSSTTPAGTQTAAANGTPTAGQGGAQESPEQPSKSHEFFEVAITTGGVLSGPDGNVWIFRASDPARLYSVNPSGEVLKHFQLAVPAPGLKPFGIGFAGPDEIYIHFVRFAGAPGASVSPSDVVGIFDTDSERFESLYALPDTEKGMRVLACSDHRG